MAKVNLFNASFNSIEKFIKELIYLYHLYTKDKMRSYHKFIHYLDKGWDYEDEYKNNDNDVKRWRDYIVENYQYDLNNENFREFIETSFCEYISNYYCYIKDNIDTAKSIFLENNYNNVKLEKLYYDFLSDYFSYISKNINKFLLSVYDFKIILKKSFPDNNKNEISKSIQNLIESSNKNFEFFMSLRIFIDSVENLLNNINNNTHSSAEERKISLEKFFENDNFFYLSKIILDSKTKYKNINILSNKIINILNSYAHNPTHKKEYNYKISNHNYFLNKTEELWDNNYFIYDVFKYVFSSYFLNLLDTSLRNKMKDILISKIKKNYDRVFCSYFQYMLYIFLKNNSNFYDDNIFEMSDTKGDYRIDDYNYFFNIFDLNKKYLIISRDTIISDIKNLYDDISNFSNISYLEKRKFIINRINKLNLPIFNNVIISIEVILNEIYKIDSIYSINSNSNLNFEKLYVFFTVKDYKEILNLASEKSKEVTIKLNLDFYNFILSVKENPIYFVISFLKSNDLLVSSYEQLFHDPNNISKNNKFYSEKFDDKFSTIYEQRILLVDKICENLNKIKRKTKKI